MANQKSKDPNKIYVSGLFKSEYGYIASCGHDTDQLKALADLIDDVDKGEQLMFYINETDDGKKYISATKNEDRRGSSNGKPAKGKSSRKGRGNTEW